MRTGTCCDCGDIFAAARSGPVSVRCPPCRKRHRDQARGSLALCQWCGVTVLRTYHSSNNANAAYCCREHANWDRAYRKTGMGPRSPSWYVNCPRCGHVEACHNPGKSGGRDRYCPDCKAAVEAARYQSHLVGDRTLTCDWCKGEFTHNGQGLSHYCSDECREKAGRAYDASYRKTPVAKEIKARRRARKRGADGTHTAAEWQARLEEYDYRCVYCGRRGGRLTRDHVVPLSRGGSDYIANIVPACRKCNSEKRDLLINDQWTPTMPTGQVALALV